MENSLIKKNYKKKIKLIKKYNKLYYDRSDPLVSDKEYDKLKKDIINIEEKYPTLINKNSPSQSVGFKPSNPEIADIVKSIFFLNFLLNVSKEL